MARDFQQLCHANWSERRFVCVGLDSDYKKLPESATDTRTFSTYEDRVRHFNQNVVDATMRYAGAYKPNLAFYLKLRGDGLSVLRDTVSYVHHIAPQKLVIVDTKDADIGATNEGYADMLEYLGADAVTTNPYLGEEALVPLLKKTAMGIFVLCHTSNPGAQEFQEREVVVPNDELKELGVDPRDHGFKYVREASGGAALVPLYQLVALRVARIWNAGRGNCGLVMGATYPKQMAEVRKLVGDIPFLIPGIGKQAGDLEQTVKYGQDSRGQGMFINSSSGIIFAKDPGQQTQELHSQINQYL